MHGDLHGLGSQPPGTRPAPPGLAFLVARHKLLPRDPLHLEGWTDQAELLARVVGEVPLSQAEAMQLLPA